MPAKPDEEGFGVWPENCEALALFLACQTQWRGGFVAGMGGGAMIWQGLDYAGVETCHRRRGGSWEGKKGVRLWGDLQAMEAAALAELNGGGR